MRVASPSDEPFDTYDETVIDATVFYRMPAEGMNGWAFFLNYGNRRAFLNNIPLPGVAYAYVPNRSTFALVGVPVLIFRSRFGDGWGAEFFYFPPIRGRFHISYDVTPRLAAHTGVRSYRDAFLRSDREDADEWLRHEIILGDVGLRWQVDDRLSLDSRVGYSFDRHIYESDSFSDDDDRIDLDNGFSFRLQMTASL